MKIAFFCIPAHGHTNPTLAVVRELTARGHSVWYYSYDVMREPVEAAGATFVPCDGDGAARRLSPRKAGHVGANPALSVEILADTALALRDPVRASLERLRPDCVVADSMAIWGKAAAQTLGIPFVSSNTTFAFNRYSAEILKQTPGDLLRMLRSLPGLRRQLRRLQRGGYPVRGLLDLLQSDPQVDTIVYTSPEFQPRSETFPSRFAFVGPSIRPASGVFQKSASRLVYLSMGTVCNDLLPLYRRCVQALTPLDCQVVLSVGDQVQPEALGPLPDRFTVAAHVDQIAVLEQADVFLSHCGMNSASESLYFGVPLVMLPRTAEQRGVAERVRQLGAGVLPPRTDAASLRDAVLRVLNDPSFRRGAAAVADGFRRCPGPKGAADKILAVARRPQG